MSHCGLYGAGGRVVLVGLVEAPGVAQPLEARAVVGRRRAELVEDLREPVGAGVVGRLGAPVDGGEQAGRPQDQDRVDRAGPAWPASSRGLRPSCPGTPASARPSGRPGRRRRSGTRSRLIRPTPLPPKTQLSHMPVKRRQAGQRIEAVVHAVDRAAGRPPWSRRRRSAPAEVPKRSSLPSRLPSS